MPTLTMEGVAIFAGSLTVMIVAIKTLTSWRPARWAFRQLVTIPVRHEMEAVIDSRIAGPMQQNREDIASIRQMVDEVLKEVRINGGSTLKDLALQSRDDYASLVTQIDRIEAEVFRQEEPPHGP